MNYFPLTTNTLSKADKKLAIDVIKSGNITRGNYNKLNDIGYVPEETEIDNGDMIIGKVSPIQPTGNNNKVYKDSRQLRQSRPSSAIGHGPGYGVSNIYCLILRLSLN